MNHHAEKIVHGLSGQEESDAGSEGVLAEFHACAACGSAAMRVSESIIL
jgi:hypothetical protein